MTAEIDDFDEYLFLNGPLDEGSVDGGNDTSSDEEFLYADLTEDDDDDEDEDGEDAQEDEDEDGEDAEDDQDEVYAHGEPLSRDGCDDRFSNLTIQGDKRFEKLFMEYSKDARARGELDRDDLRDTIITYLRMKAFIPYLAGLVSDNGQQRFRYPARLASALSSWAGRHWWCGGSPEGIMFGEKDH